MKRHLLAVFALLSASNVLIQAQQPAVPILAFEPVPNPLKLPADMTSAKWPALQ